MDAIVTGETDSLLGLSIVDNNDVEHIIDVHKDSGEVTGHDQDKYSEDPSTQTNTEAEYIMQARRYAKWYAYRERGYDTVSPADNPDRILAALLAVLATPEETFQSEFDDIETQIASHYDDRLELELPFSNAEPSDVLVYQKDLYVRPDPTSFDPPVLDQYLARFPDDSDPTSILPPHNLDEEMFDKLGFEFEAISEMYTLHNDGQGNEQAEPAPAPLQRESDARVELIPFDPSEIGVFQHYVASHLLFQIRDCFLWMGQIPPKLFRLQGHGKYRGTLIQQACEQYEKYCDPTASIDSWEPVP
jgi:hypothetical protein